MKKLRNHEHFYPILDIMIERAVEECAEDDEAITCRKGCAHCCHLLVETSWEEARELVLWLMDLPEEKRQTYFNKISANAEEFRQLCLSSRKHRRFVHPIVDEVEEMPDALCDDYFYQKKRPCPFLDEQGCCSAYEARPSACRLHMVSSNPDMCRPEAEDDNAYVIPEAIDELQDEVGPMNSALAQDGRWGQLATMVKTMLAEEFDTTITHANN